MIKAVLNKFQLRQFTSIFRRFSFPPNFLNSSCDNADNSNKKDDVEIDDEHTALKSPLLKANSYDV